MKKILVFLLLCAGLVQAQVYKPSGGSGTTSYTPTGTGSESVMVADALNIVSVGGLGDFSPDNVLFLFSGDSTTEQDQGSGYGFDRLTELRKPGEVLERVVGTVSFGASGHRLDDWLTGAAATPPTIVTTNAGINQWDYYGHKPSGATSLATQLNWRAGKADKVCWVVCYGINDLILYAATGNLTQAQISDYIAQRLRTAITRIQKAYPKDKIILRTPNPMTARPFTAGQGFPSSTAYPNFGQDLPTDQALVEKWNQGLRNGYLAVRNDFSGVRLFDTWDRVFGQSTTTLTAGTQLPLLGDLVHPSGAGYSARASAFAEFLVPPSTLINQAKKYDAELKVTNLGGNVWDYYPGYFRGDVRYKKVADLKLVGIGSNYVDLGMSLTAFTAATGQKAIYVVINSKAAQYFSNYAASVSGANTRLTGVSPTGAMQATGGNTIEIYQDNTFSFIANDSYVDTQVKNSKEYYVGTIAGGGVGYIDFVFSSDSPRLSTKYLGGFKAGQLAVGGTTSAIVSLSTGNPTRSSTTSARYVRTTGMGSTDYSSYVGKPAALFFADDKPSPRAYEAVFTLRSVIPHAQNNRGFVHCPLTMADGATLSIFLTEPIAQSVTVDVYNKTYPTNTLIGTITIPANQGSATLTTGNPSTVGAGQIYEFVITSATSQATGVVGLAVTPN
ncbi:SGNH/GDSL hydrolase family protein [Spirosoma agri]|uniref:SGNH/GDSL hydrolase family protein n=1 Tax=Spirosoma agri TaxID=1987381 RepID=A0A6M0IJ30_9BACT|nr:SGNH/GDSL hydrolase family protein [Spirosoma agri]NEU68296.1 SGNH/GDSL hydrolase family protein [Spirosoma agri]